MTLVRPLVAENTLPQMLAADGVCVPIAIGVF